MHEVAQAVAGTTVAVAVLGGGSSCDFMKDLPPATAATRLTSTRVVRRDLIRIDCEDPRGQLTTIFAVNNSNVGLIADAARRVNNAPRSWPIDLAAVVAGAQAHRSTKPFDLLLPEVDQPRISPLINLTILKSDRICGGMRLGVRPASDDGRFVVVATRPASLPGLLTALYRGQASRHAAVSWWTTDSVRLLEPAGSPIEADGELVGNTPANYSVLAGGLRVLN